MPADSGREAVIRPGATLAETIGRLTTELRVAGCPDPEADAKELVSTALGRTRFRSTAILDVSAAARTQRYLRQRLARMPIEYIVGRCRFRGLEIFVDQRVMVPRPESELLVERAVELPRGQRIHEVGTGSGAIALAIKNERPDLCVSASDISLDAIAVAQANSRRLKLDVALTAAPNLPRSYVPYDLVVALPPFLPDGDAHRLPLEAFRFEPRVAHTAGRDGLDVIRAIIDSALPGTNMALAHAPSQGSTIRELLAGALTLQCSPEAADVTVGIVPGRKVARPDVASHVGSADTPVAERQKARVRRAGASPGRVRHWTITSRP